MSPYPTTIPALSAAHHATLSQYSACDISDALLALKIPHAGFLPDISRIASPASPAPSAAAPAASAPLIARASTVLFVPKLPVDRAAYTLQHALPHESNIPPGAHYVDCVTPGTVVVQAQPDGQRNAVLGGIMAARMKVLGVAGVVVGGRVRDLAELRESGLPVCVLPLVSSLYPFAMISLCPLDIHILAFRL
jgi:regulator of RNase E activity RraA